MGDDRGAAVPDALQEGPAHQEVHQDRCTVSSFAHIPVYWERGPLQWQIDELDLLFVALEVTTLFLL